MNIGVIFAGGVGSRMHSKDRPKQFLEVFGKPIIIHTLEHFQKNEMIDAIVISCHADYLEHMQSLADKYHISKVRRIVKGGKTGQLSIYNGLCAAEDIAGGEKTIVLIHDGVRPLITSALLSENIRAVQEYGSCITGGIVKETITTIDDDNNILQVPSRECSRVAKAPQSFWLEDILQVQRAAIAAGEYNHIDCCTLMSRYDYKLHMIDGPYENIKITTPEDFFTMRAIFEIKENEQIYLPESF